MVGLSRRGFVLGTTGLGLLAGCGALPPPAPPPQRARLPRVGVLFGSVPVSSPEAAAFQEAMQSYGYADGHSVAIEYRSVEGHDEWLPSMAAELAGLSPDVVVTFGVPGVEALRAVVGATPIVMSVNDPVRMGFVDSLSRPGGNITGLSILGVQLGEKRLELLKHSVPTISRVAALGTAEAAQELLVAEVASGTLGVQLRFVEMAGSGDPEAVLQAAVADGAQAVLLLATAANAAPAVLAPIAQLALARQLPTMAPYRRFIDVGGLMSYGPSSLGQWRRAAYYVDRILRGAKPADIPIEQPMTFDFVVNFATAEALGITFPESIRLQVTEVIR
jgi:putative ABC transport system substrate-binding protein